MIKVLNASISNSAVFSTQRSHQSAGVAQPTERVLTLLPFIKNCHLQRTDVSNVSKDCKSEYKNENVTKIGMVCFDIKNMLYRIRIFFHEWRTYNHEIKFIVNIKINFIKASSIVNVKINFIKASKRSA